MKATKNLVIAARGLLGMTQDELADAAGLHRHTVIKFENGEEIAERSLLRIQVALESRGVEFLNDKRPGVRMAERKE